MLSFQSLLQLLLAEHSVFPPKGLLKARLGLQRLLVAQHRVVVFPKHLCGQPERADERSTVTDVRLIRNGNGAYFASEKEVDAATSWTDRVTATKKKSSVV